MIVPGFVVTHNPFLDAFLRHLQGNVDFAVLTPVGGHNTKLNGIQGMSGISAGKLR